MDVHIPKDRETGRPRGFAFVRFAEEAQAQQAVEQFHGREVGGRALRLDIAEDRPRPPRQRRDFRSSQERGSRDDRGPRVDFSRNDRGGPAPTQDAYSRDDFARDNFDRSDHDRDFEDDGQGGRGRSSYDRPKRPKGSRRGLRGKKRSL